MTKECQEYRFEEPKQDAEYVIGADWAKAQDWTVITVADVTRFPVRVVHWSRMRRLPYPVMIGEFNKLMKEYNAEGIHDATGLGAVVADYIDRRARGFLMTGAQRDNMLSEYVSSIENHRWLAPRMPVFYKNHLYASVDMLYARGQGVPPPGRDLLDGAVLAAGLQAGDPGAPDRDPRRPRSDLDRGGDAAEQGRQAEARELGGGRGAEQVPGGR